MISPFFCFLASILVVKYNAYINPEKDAHDLKAYPKNVLSRLVPAVSEESIGFTIAATLQVNYVDKNDKRPNRELEVFGLAVTEEFALYLDIKHPHRIPIVRAYEVVKGLLKKRSRTEAPLQIDTSYRLEVNRIHSIIVQAKYYDYKMQLFVFLNGQLYGQYPVTTLQDHFQDRQGSYEFSILPEPVSNPDPNMATLQTAFYWNRVLSYLEIKHMVEKAKEEDRQLQLLFSKPVQPSTSPTSTPTKRPALSWLTGNVMGNKGNRDIDSPASSHSNSNETASTNQIDKQSSQCSNNNVNGPDTCVDTALTPTPTTLTRDSFPTAIFLWPTWYSDFTAGVELTYGQKIALMSDSLYGIVSTLPNVARRTVANNESEEDPSTTSSHETTMEVDPEGTETGRPSSKSSSSNNDENTVVLINRSDMNVPVEIVILSKIRDVPIFERAIQMIGAEFPQISIVIYSFESDSDYYARVINRAVRASEMEYVILLSTHILPMHDWLPPLLFALTDKTDGGYGAGIVGGKILTTQNKILHAGYEYFELPFAGGLEMYLTPHDRYRGYWGNDKRSLGIQHTDAVSRRLLGIKKDLWEELLGMFLSMSPIADDLDLCARAAYDGYSVVVVGDSKAVSIGPLVMKEDQEKVYTSDTYNPKNMPESYLNSLRKFSERWIGFYQARRRVNYVTDARFTWIIHCGGSQGLEAATILQELHKMVDVRTIIRRYRECEHADTIDGMPESFRDVLEYTTSHIFTKPYVGPYLTKEEKLEFTTSDRERDASIVLYARDYRELGRWIPSDGSYYIGRYMYESDGLPESWARHQNLLDEVWVPSKWQKDVFSKAGVEREKLHVLGETVDSNYFDPDLVQPLAMPGSVLDRFSRDDPNRPFVMCSVYKMEDRKGWHELIESYTKEFRASDNVLLLLRTYLHLMGGLTADVYNATEIYRQMTKHLDSIPDMTPSEDRPPIDLVSDHLPSWQMPMFYKNCDAFVLPTHGEGWGLPTHEAMIMGIPVLTTNWGGSTEFVTEESGLLLNIEGMTPTSETDPWLRGFNWAKIDLDDLQRKMRLLFSNRTLAKEIGAKGKAYALEHFSPYQVAKSYADRLASIQSALIPRLPETHGELITSSFDRNYDLHEFPKFQLCAVSYRSNHSAGSLAMVKTKGGERKKKVGRGGLCDYVIVSTWAPRECGIATFSAALRDALLSVCPKGSRIDVIAMIHDTDDRARYDSTIVKNFIREYDHEDYVKAAQFINDEKYGTVLLEYEFGMIKGEYLICLMRHVKARIITTLHTVIRSYSEHNQAYVQQVELLSYRMVVMTHMMRHGLQSFHAIPGRNTVVIPHGVPDLPFNRLEGSPNQYFYPGRTIIFSNGLLHQKKGIEYVIRAMPRIIEFFPEVLYVVSGKPHPSGWGAKDYYEELKTSVKKEGLQKHVVFNETFVPTAELYTMLQSVAVYVNAYTDTDQSVSGTLAMAMGTGAACISTPYPYALEMLRNNTGILVPFQESTPLADAIIYLLSNPEAAQEMRLKAYETAQAQIWEEVGTSYVQLSLMD